MRAASSTGWRGTQEVYPASDIEPQRADKTDLFEASRIAARVLRLPANCRFILDQLCGVYGGELIENRILVWPSNDFLLERTGIPERSIRYAIHRLIKEGVVIAKDSPNGKRYAQRKPDGTILRAFGFDLTPLVNRIGEFKARMEELKAVERERKLALDEITILRRSVQETLIELHEHYPETSVAQAQERFEKLLETLPRRSGKACVKDALGLWKTLSADVDKIYTAACGGNNGRHKDNNKYAFYSSCYKGYRFGESGALRRETSNIRDLESACPDSMAFIGHVCSDHEFITAASRMRGAFGISLSGWDEACASVGELNAAAAMIYVMQMQMAPLPDAQPIKNAGGYYRVMVRLMKEGQVSLTEEVQKLMVKRISL